MRSTPDRYIITKMERVTKRTFDKKCLLLKAFGYKIKGTCDDGIILSNAGVDAIPTRLTVCKFFCKRKGCNSSTIKDDGAAIIAKIS